MVLSDVGRIETERVEMFLISFWQITKAVAANFSKSPGPGILRLVLGPHLSPTNLRTRVALSPPSLNIFNAGPFCFRAETMDDSAALQNSAGQTYGRRILLVFNLGVLRPVALYLLCWLWAYFLIDFNVRGSGSLKVVQRKTKIIQVTRIRRPPSVILT